ncbi:MAG: type II toxin-antitoxin system HicB family antitoxin [Snowella sp.]|nr:type II toxin-antitoxin system HicB family antitoxin [Snowella sp.]
MITDYIAKAMQKATYELLEDGTFYGEIPDCEGVWSQANNLEACRDNLQDALEGWVILGIRFGHQFPVLDGISLNSLPEVA